MSLYIGLRLDGFADVTYVDVFHENSDHDEMMYDDDDDHEWR